MMIRTNRQRRDDRHAIEYMQTHGYSEDATTLLRATFDLFHNGFSIHRRITTARPGAAE